MEQTVERVNLMPTVLTVLFVIIMVILVLSLVSKSPGGKNQKRMRLKKIDYSGEPLPVGLGYKKELPLHAFEQRMDDALRGLFLEQLKKRVLEAHPNLTAEEYEWKLFELKRYFAMNVILRQVPMF